jgi:hypothetical protein
VALCGQSVACFMHTHTERMSDKEKEETRIKEGTRKGGRK